MVRFELTLINRRGVGDYPVADTPKKVNGNRGGIRTHSVHLKGMGF